MECRSAQINTGSFAANAGLRGPSVAVIPGREAAGMLVGPVSNAGHYNYERLTQLNDQAIYDRCAALGLSIEHAQRLAVAANETDPQSLLRVLGLDFATLAPLKPRRWLWMVAQTSSVSYRRILTPETLLEILTTGDVPPIFFSHVLHLLDEAPIQCVVMAVEQAAQKSGIPIEVLWRNVELISEKTQSRRNGAWTMNNKESRNK